MRTALLRVMKIHPTIRSESSLGFFSSLSFPFSFIRASDFTFLDARHKPENLDSISYFITVLGAQKPQGQILPRVDSM